MQTVPAIFNQLADADVQPTRYGLRISFDKSYNPATTFFQLNVSQLNGADLLAPSTDNPMQSWDHYAYSDHTDRVVTLTCERELEFPYSVVLGMADFELANFDGYYTPGSVSPISEYIIPSRPVRMLAGFANIILPQFVGLTDAMPEVSDSSKTATFHAVDFLTQIFDMDITSTIAMRDVYTDEVLAEIFTQAGLAPEQYNLRRGRNKIPFLFYQKKITKAGELIRELMEAEMGMLWLDEQGIIQFAPRLDLPSTPVMFLGDENVVDIQTNTDKNITNKVRVTAEIREVQPWQVVHQKDATSGETFVIAPGDTRVYEGDLTDPIISAIAPTMGEATGVSWFTALDQVGNPVTTNIDVDGDEIKQSTYNVTFTNNNSFPIEIAEVEIWGEPAKVVDVIDYTASDADSILKYGDGEDTTLTIENNFLQSISQARSLALLVLDQYKEHSNVLIVTIKGNHALQLGDVVDLDARTYDGQYRIIGITNKIQDGLYTQILKLRHYTPRHWFQLNVSQLNGTDVLAP